MLTLRLFAFIAMVTGVLKLLDIRLLDLFKSVFDRPKSIRDQVNEVTNKKKKNFLRREVEEISGLEEKYDGQIEIYCGVEEDAFSYVKRQNFDYIIGSSHYFCVKDKYYSIDSSTEHFNECLELFDNNVLKLSEAYYSTFVSYINDRKPDIVGHFDIITKFDEIGEARLLNNDKYFEIAEKYLKIAAETDAIFEVNTGAMSRGIRTTPYLGERLLHVLKDKGSKLILSSDCHSIDTLNAYFDDVIYMLRSIGFDCVYELYQGEFKKKYIL